MTSDLNAFFERARPAIERSLEALLPPETVPPEKIHKAMRYSTLDGGKRVRPCLCIAAYALYKDNFTPILPIASAIEIVHAYSLVHDDLPAMDDDDFRRGKASCHKQFDEATAILAGDALLTLAFEILAGATDFPPDSIVRVIGVLSESAGSSTGMIAGQMLDLEAEGRRLSANELEAIHRSKTGALISAAVWIGAFLGGAPASDLQCIKNYSERIGLAFQIVDDIRDETDGKDRDQEKATYPQVHGLEQSRSIVHALMTDARRSISDLGGRGQMLVDFCDFLEHRSS